MIVPLESWTLLTSCMCDADPEVRGMACAALVRIGAGASEVCMIVPLLQSLLGSELEDVRAGAVEVVIAITEGKTLSATQMQSVCEFAIAILKRIESTDPTE